MEEIFFGYRETWFDRLRSRYQLLDNVCFWFTDGQWIKPVLVLLITLMVLCIAALVYLTFFYELKY